MSTGEVIAMTPLGWAAVASLHLSESFPDLTHKDSEVQAILRPLFRKAMDLAIEHAHQGLIPTPPGAPT